MTLSVMALDMECCFDKCHNLNIIYDNNFSIDCLHTPLRNILYFIPKNKALAPSLLRHSVCP